MKKECSMSALCPCNPALSLAVLRGLVGLMFIMAGTGKIGDVSAFAGTLGDFGYTGVFATIVAWFVVLAELIGGVALLAGKFIPSCKVRKLLVAVLLPVIIGIIYHTNIPAVLDGSDPMAMMGLLYNLILFFLVWFLAVMKPACPFGISGCKTLGSCDVKNAKK